jgi:type IV pilus assembly protein PilC
MAKYAYQAITETGATNRGVIEAESVEAANTKLSAQGYIPTQVREIAGSVSGLNLEKLKDRFTPVSIPDILLFTKQFRTMVRAGVSMLNLLQILEAQTENPKFQKIIHTLHQDISEGDSLSEAFRKHPQVFSPLYCSMVQAGEASGALPEILDRMTYILSHEHKIKKDIHSALQYPAIVLVFLGVAFVVLLTFVIPKFVNIFQNAGLDLPLPTVICMQLYAFMSQFWPMMLGGAILAGIALYLYLKTEAGQFTKDKVFLSIPIIGPLLQKAAISRFASIFSILHSSGVDILESMRILAGTIGNAAISRDVDRIRSQLEEGRGIAGPLSTSSYFTPMLINMVAIGEESGNLQEMLQEVSDHYDTEVSYAMEKLAGAIGPMLTIGLAAVVGFFALAIFLPMWDLTTMVK